MKNWTRKSRVCSNSGFSLLEILVVMSVVSMLVAGSLATFHAMKSRGALNDARSTTVRMMEEARTRAMTGYGTGNHGVYVKEGSIIIFEGSEYVEGAGTEISFSGGITTDQTGAGIVFSRLTGLPSATITVILSSYEGEQKSVTVTDDGAVQTD